MKRPFYFLLGLLFLSMAISSCESDSDPNAGIIGSEDSLQLRFNDTTTLVAFIEKDDTLRSDGTERVLLGSYYDPIFGKTSSSFYSSFTMAQSFASNANMLFDEKSLEPMYKLHLGQPGSSFTFEVAEKIGLSPAYIDEAKEKLSTEKVYMDKLLNKLQAEKNVIARLRKDLQKQMSKTTAEKREFQELSEKAISFILRCFEPDPDKRATSSELLDDPFITE